MFSILQYINGGSLDQVVADNDFELPWTAKLSLSLDIAKGMEYLHSRGWFHRDLTSKVSLCQNGWKIYICTKFHRELPKTCHPKIFRLSQSGCVKWVICHYSRSFEKGEKTTIHKNPFDPKK